MITTKKVFPFLLCRLVKMGIKFGQTFEGKQKLQTFSILKLFHYFSICLELETSLAKASGNFKNHWLAEVQQ
jgi:hypothetical protein